MNIVSMKQITNALLGINYKKNFMAPFHGWGSTALRLEPLRGGSLLLPLSPQNFLVLTLSTLEG